MKWWVPTAVIMTLGISGVLATQATQGIDFGMGQRAPSVDLAALTFPPYAPQRVVYHVVMQGGRGDRAYLGLMSSVLNHTRALGKDETGASRLEARLVLQGDGVELLSAAKNNAALAAKIDELRAYGVKFLICRNTLIERRIDIGRDLYRAEISDVVPAGVAEASALQQRGFVYLRF